jgi:hypothetical protein
MCFRRFATQTAEKFKMQAMELARQHTKDEVVAFEREGEVAQAAMVRVLEDVSAVAAAARKAVEAVAMEAAMAALCAMRNDPTIVSLEAMAVETTKVTMRELRDDVVARQASVKAQMYSDDAEDEESRIAAKAMVAIGTTAEAAEQAAHWAAEVDKTLAYRMDVDGNTAARWMPPTSPRLSRRSAAAPTLSTALSGA